MSKHEEFLKKLKDLLSENNARISFDKDVYDYPYIEIIVKNDTVILHADGDTLSKENFK